MYEKHEFNAQKGWVSCQNSETGFCWSHGMIGNIGTFIDITFTLEDVKDMGQPFKLDKTLYFWFLTNLSASEHLL